jgi:hypothetical protein
MGEGLLLNQVQRLPRQRSSGLNDGQHKKQDSQTPNNKLEINPQIIGLKNLKKGFIPTWTMPFEDH